MSSPNFGDTAILAADAWADARREDADAYEGADRWAAARLEELSRSLDKIPSLRWVRKDGHEASVHERNTAD